MTTVSLPGVEDGLAALLGAVLAAAGVAKLLNPELTRISIRRLVSRDATLNSRYVALAVTGIGAGELGLGVALVAAPVLQTSAATVLTVAAVALCAAFVGVLRRAARLGAACGCFGSFSVRVPGPIERARALGLLAVAVASLGLRLWRPDAPTGAPGWVVGLLLGAAVTAAAMLAVAGSPKALAEALKPGPAAQWRPVAPLTRRRILRAVRGAEQVSEVVGKLGAEPPWHRAELRVSGRPVRLTKIMVITPEYRLQIIRPASGELAVVAFTPGGMIVPRRPAPAVAAPKPLPPPRVPTGA